MYDLEFAYFFKILQHVCITLSLPIFQTTIFVLLCVIVALFIPASLAGLSSQLWSLKEGYAFTIPKCPGLRPVNFLMKVGLPPTNMAIYVALLLAGVVCLGMIPLNCGRVKESLHVYVGSVSTEYHQYIPRHPDI